MKTAQQARALDAEEREAVRAVRMGPTYNVWLVMDNGEAAPREVAADTLAEILREIAHEGTFGKRFVILETDPVSRKAIQHLYQVRRGKWLGRSNPNGTKAYPHTADHLASLKVAAFIPVEPWKWTPGCDVVGIDRDLIEVRP